MELIHRTRPLRHDLHNPKDPLNILRETTARPGDVASSTQTHTTPRNRFRLKQTTARTHRNMTTCVHNLIYSAGTRGHNSMSRLCLTITPKLDMVCTSIHRHTSPWLTSPQPPLRPLNMTRPQPPLSSAAHSSCPATHTVLHNTRSASPGATSLPERHGLTH
jgi:hypothetical protein